MSPSHGFIRDASHDGPSVQRRQTSGGFAGTSKVAPVADIITQLTPKLGGMLFIISLRGNQPVSTPSSIQSPTLASCIMISLPPVAQCVRESIQTGAADATTGEATVTAFAVVRKLPTQNQHLDLRVAVVGNVDAGKSTLVGVLTGPLSFLDDGRGLARSRVLRHKHEAETGRTSSIAEDQHMRLNTKGLSLAAERHQKAVADAAETAKVVSFIDLAGHERYLRTTVYGLTAHEPSAELLSVSPQDSWRCIVANDLREAGAW